MNGLRTGLAEAVRGYAELRSLVPRGIKLSPEDIWAGVEYILSLKLVEPSFAGQTKERLASREAAAYVAGVSNRAVERWLSLHTEDGDWDRRELRRAGEGAPARGQEHRPKEKGTRIAAPRQAHRLHSKRSGPLRDLPG